MEASKKNMEQFMKTSRIRSFTVLMKHVDPFYRVGFDDAAQNHVLQKISTRCRSYLTNESMKDISSNSILITYC